MKATEITMQIVKSIGLYETCRLEATFTLDSGDDLIESFVTARKELEQAYATAYAKTYGLKNDNRKVLNFGSKELERVRKALLEGKTNINELQEIFKMSDEVINYFKEKKLI